MQALAGIYTHENVIKLYRKVICIYTLRNVLHLKKKQSSMKMARVLQPEIGKNFITPQNRPLGILIKHF